jgi:hypothetical protein
VKLAAYGGQSNFFSILRDLRAEEIQRDDEYSPVVADARERLKLFKILDHNYREWSDHVTSLLSARPGDRDDEMLHLDRLLLNYLTCAYTLRKHFEVLFKQRFRNEDPKQKVYTDFLDRLCAASWPVAFFFDFRGYVQHRGLGIGHYNRKISDLSVQLTISCDGGELHVELEMEAARLKQNSGSKDGVFSERHRREKGHR